MKKYIDQIFQWFENRIEPYPESQPITPHNGLWQFIWSCLAGVRGWIVLLAIGSAVNGILEALLFQFMGKIVDWLNTSAPNTFLHEHGSALLGMMALLIFAIIWHFGFSLLRLQTLQGAFPMRLRWNFHRLMLAQSLGFYQDEFAGRVSAKVMQTALAVREVVTILMGIAIYFIVYFFTTGVILSTLDWRLLLPFIAWGILFGTLMRFLIPRLGKTAQRQADARSLMTGRITDAYANIATVKLFSHGAREARYAKESMQEFMHTVHAQMRLATLLDSGNFAANAFLTLSTAALGIWLWHSGSVSAGAVAVAITMALKINGLSQHIMWESALLFENIGTVTDGMHTLSKARTIIDKPTALPLNITRGDITFQDIDFSYENGKSLLNNFHLHIKAGEKIGLIGRSGAGKSTLVNLLLRFYEPQRGQILIDGQNIDNITQESLRAHIGLVTQDTGLLHRSVRDNIVYGRPNASNDEMLQAALKAKAHDFIEQLSDSKGRKGYHAHVGERGVKLSGGQRQRIAIARVILKDAPILILDEATSALDSEVEVAIQQSLDMMMDGKTVIAIAHRLSTIAAMDRLIVLDNGQIAEQGTHAELLAKGGLYAKLWAHQSGGFIAKNPV